MSPKKLSFLTPSFINSYANTINISFYHDKSIDFVFKIVNVIKNIYDYDIIKRMYPEKD